MVIETDFNIGDKIYYLEYKSSVFCCNFCDNKRTISGENNLIIPCPVCGGFSMNINAKDPPEYCKLILSKDPLIVKRIIIEHIDKWTLVFYQDEYGITIPSFRVYASIEQAKAHMNIGNNITLA